MTTPLPKRPRAHVLEALSRQYVEGIFPTEWLCRWVEDDYGLDMRVEIVAGGEVTGMEFSVQLKGTDHLKVFGDDVLHRCAVSTANYFLRRPEPVMYVVYDAQGKTAYWLWVKFYLRQLDETKPGWRAQKTVQIRIPHTSRLTAKSVPAIAKTVQTWWGRVISMIGWVHAPDSQVVQRPFQPPPGLSTLTGHEDYLTVLPLHQLPPPPRDFTGRDVELAQLTTAFERDDFTIFGVCGLGGIGKTAFALKLAEQLASHYPDAQFYLDMKGTSSTPLSSVDAMAHVIRSYFPPYERPRSEAEVQGHYRSVLHGERALLLMDNVKDAAQVEPLIPPAGCVLLVTSRRHFTVPGLYLINLGVLPASDAHALLLHIAARIGDYADEIAKLCGYLPLALRLAANALTERIDLSPVDYIHKLTDASQRLNLTGVEASLSLSYGLLSPRLQRLWCMLAVFSGSVSLLKSHLDFPAQESISSSSEENRPYLNTFDREAAAAVWNLNLASASDALSELVRYSLVDYIPPFSTDERNSGNEGRYHLHELVRLFAESRLSKADYADARRRYIVHDKALWSTIIEKHAGRIHIIVSRIIAGYGELEDTEELVQDVFIKVLYEIDKYDPSRGSFATWLNMLAKYTALDFRRKATRNLRLFQPLVDTHDVHEMFIAESLTKEFGQMEKEQQERALRAALKELPEPKAQLITWRYRDGKTYKEIAELTHCSVGTARSRVKRALQELEANLSRL